MPIRARGIAKRMLARLSERALSASVAGSPPTRALSWIVGQELPTGGIRTHSAHDTAYPEVSGYLIPTLIESGEPELAARILDWLLCIQRGDGAFCDPDSMQPHLFDTGQILRGLLCFCDDPHAEDAMRRAGRFLVSSMDGCGEKGFPPQYDGEISEAVLMYALGPLKQAGLALGEPSFVESAEACLMHYAQAPILDRIEQLTHFMAYEIEALIEMGREDLARPALDALAALQLEDGSVRGRGGESWICTPGLAQIAVCWYKLGLTEPADRAMAWLDAKVGPQGQLYGSYGPGASYFERDCIPWANKYYLDAHRLRVHAMFRDRVHEFPKHVPPEDGRVSALCEVVRPRHRVAEIGCGRGRFLHALSERIGSLDLFGVDISEAMLEAVDPDIETRVGSLERIPYPDQSFDVTFSVEAIEHALNPRAAVREMVRITRAGGWIIIVDKQQSHAGQLETQAWEAWPRERYLKQQLARWCDDVSAVPVGYDDHAADGLMLAWRGRRRQSPARDSNAAAAREQTVEPALERLRKYHLAAWDKLLFRRTAPGHKVLDLGTGSLDSSLRLALGGRHVHIGRPGARDIVLCRAAAEELELEIEATTFDLLESLPFAADSFDCVWNNGLLGTVGSDRRKLVLAECARVSRDLVISVVPNAASLAYQFGRHEQQIAGRWPFGREIPVATLHSEYSEAGLDVIDEQSFGAAHALNYLPPRHPLTRLIEGWMAEHGATSLDAWRQGYVLVTVGRKRVSR